MVKILKKRVVYRNPYQTITEVVARSGAVRKTLYVDDHGTRVGLLVVERRRVLLVSQDRLFTGGRTFEIPGGRADEGEGLADAAARECLEETGYRCRTVRPLLHYLPGLDTLHNPTHIFLGLRPSRAHRGARDPREATRSHWVALSRCLSMVKEGKIKCGMTIAALLMYVASGRGESGRVRKAP